MNAEPQSIGNKYGVVIFTSQDQVGRCSGTLVSLEGRTFVVTAAHCFAGPGATTKEYKVSRNSIQSNGEVSAQDLGVIHSIQLHPKYKFKSKSESNPYDIAIAQLRTVKRIALQGLRPASKDWSPQSQADVRQFFIGAGSQSVEYEKNPGPPTVLVGEYQSEIQWERGSAWSSVRDLVQNSPAVEGDLLKMSARSEQDPIVCVGDSGGGFVEDNNQEVTLVGVISTAGIRTFNGVRQCWWYPFVIVPVSAHRDWIESVVQSW